MKRGWCLMKNRVKVTTRWSAGVIVKRLVYITAAVLWEISMKIVSYRTFYIYCSTQVQTRFRVKGKERKETLNYTIQRQYKSYKKIFLIVIDQVAVAFGQEIRPAIWNTLLESWTWLIITQLLLRRIQYNSAINNYWDLSSGFKIITCSLVQ